jgi:serine/threonine protein kinase
MKTKTPMFRGDTEAVQLDTIFKTLGGPSATLVEKYVQFPHWEKMAITKPYEKSKNFVRYMSQDLPGMDLLTRLLDLDYSTRISAEAALQLPYFTAGPVAEPYE